MAATEGFMPSIRKLQTLLTSSQHCWPLPAGDDPPSRGSRTAGLGPHQSGCRSSLSEQVSQHLSQPERSENVSITHVTDIVQDHVFVCVCHLLSRNTCQMSVYMAVMEHISEQNICQPTCPSQRKSKSHFRIQMPTSLTTDTMT